MPRRKFSDQELIECLDAGLSHQEIADRYEVGIAHVRNTIILLKAKGVGAAQRAGDEIMRRSLDQAAIYYLQTTVSAERVVALAEKCEEWDESRGAVSDALLDIAERQADNEIFDPAFQRLLAKATEVADPHPNLFKAIDVTTKQQQLYVDMFDKAVDQKIVNEFKAAFLQLMDLDDDRVTATIMAAIEKSEKLKAFFAIDNQHSRPDRALWSQETEDRFASLPHPRQVIDILPDNIRAIDKGRGPHDEYP